MANSRFADKAPIRSKRKDSRISAPCGPSQWIAQARSRYPAQQQAEPIFRFSLQFFCRADCGWVAPPHHRASALANDRRGGDEPLVRLSDQHWIAVTADCAVVVNDRGSAAESARDECGIALENMQAGM